MRATSSRVRAVAWRLGHFLVTQSLAGRAVCGKQQAWQATGGLCAAIRTLLHLPNLPRLHAGPGEGTLRSGRRCRYRRQEWANRRRLARRGCGPRAALRRETGEVRMLQKLQLQSHARGPGLDCPRSPPSPAECSSALHGRD